SENDIVGYRVYAAKKGDDEYSHVSDIMNGDSLSYSVKNSKPYAYVVTAVDINGNESKPSKMTKTKEWKKEKKKQEKEKKEKKKNDKKDKNDNNSDNKDNNKNK